MDLLIPSIQGKASIHRIVRRNKIFSSGVLGETGLMMHPSPTCHESHACVSYLVFAMSVYDQYIALIYSHF